MYTTSLRNLSTADINECTTKKDNCSPNADCMNSNGSFTCQCKVGYDGDGVNCSE